MRSRYANSYQDTFFKYVFESFIQISHYQGVVNQRLMKRLAVPAPAHNTIMTIVASTRPQTVILIFPISLVKLYKRDEKMSI